MATDYILFVHGVNTRFDRELPSYADKLFDLVKKRVEPELKVEKIVLYWGDINKAAEDQLLTNLKASKAWNDLWFKEFREKQLLQFVGDAALYLSRTVGSQVVSKLKIQAEKILGTVENPNHKPGDRLHLVTHSWGTVILFDIMFADRWEFQEVPGHQDVMTIRKVLFGLPPTPETGIPIASIHTMGSPISLFSLLNVNGSSHDFTPRLNQLLQAIYNKRNGKKLVWENFVHPGDPVAWPLEKVVSNLVQGDSRYLDIKDVINQFEDFSDFLAQPLSQTAIALLHGGDAHSSYWQSNHVAEEIAKTIKNAAV